MTASKGREDEDVEMTEANPIYNSAVPLGQSTSSNSRKPVKEKAQSKSKSSSSIGSSNASSGSGGASNPEQIVGVKRPAAVNGNKAGVKRGVKRL